MFGNLQLQEYLQTSSKVSVESLVIAEWNMNFSDNIELVGNYRHRPLDESSPYYRINNSFDADDAGNFYTGATDADTKIDGGFDDDGTPTTFLSKKQKISMLYSLEDCFGRHRPRSGINKARFMNHSFLHHAGPQMAQRPRYYMPSKDDKFKYWSSYRVEEGIERGVANSSQSSGQYFIEDAAPFVKYKEPVPANRIVVKMQTNVGSVDLGPFSGRRGAFADPFYGEANQTTPRQWKVQVLKNGSWQDAQAFNPNSVRRDGSAVIGADGYVELHYGLRVPLEYQDTFNYIEELSSSDSLPPSVNIGDAYLVRSFDLERGKIYVWTGSSYASFDPDYGWHLGEQTVANDSAMISGLTSPSAFLGADGVDKYREFEYIEGLRIVIESMNRIDATFDLIELSPRLVANITNSVASYRVTKHAADVGTTGLPMGEMLASSGSLSIFDPDEIFNKNNSRSLVGKYLNKNLQFKFYEIIKDVNAEGNNYYVPIKTMYADGFPQYSAGTRSLSVDLRDLMYLFETTTAPEIFIQNASLSYAISLLLDSIGFSNYTYLRLPDEDELEIPNFFIAPDSSVADVLNKIAKSAQCAMFFDELNNFVVMSRGYMMPSESDRPTVFEFQGSSDATKLGIVRGARTGVPTSNIIDVNSQENNIYNDATISYTSRYIQKSYGSLRQASLIDSEKTWSYKPALLWEVTGDKSVRSVNNQVNNQSSYILSAIPLNSDLSSQVPSVVNHRIVNNIMEFGEAAYWLSRYSGYFYSSGEIIRYDAVEYSVSGISGISNVWISSVQEYQKYFSQVKFNGKIYPTGRIRIYSEPYYETVSGVTRLKNGEVRQHGRGQFGTSIVAHTAGLDSYWSSNSNVRGCRMHSGYLFGTDRVTNPSLIANAAAGRDNTTATKSTRNSIIKNFLSTAYPNDRNIATEQQIAPGTVQASALIFNGVNFDSTQNATDFVSYVHKPLTDKFTHFGTRMRIVGKVENNEIRGQTPIGLQPYYSVNSDSPTMTNQISGGSGGLAVMLNPDTNVGYYFELVALTENNLENYNSSSELHNVIFYKIVSDNGQLSASEASYSNAIPVKLWGGLTKVIVDDGKFTGQARMTNEENPTVYDLAVEYQDIGNSRRFFLYINGKQVATIDDKDPLPVYNNMALFVRGSSKCMFENIYAVANNYSQNTAFALNTPVNSVFDEEIDVNESFRKYALSGVVQAAFLAGTSPIDPPSYNIYYEEFGAIMREAAYFNVRYDKAYPALYAKLSPTFNKIKGYTTSAFIAGAYGAEFMVFNSTDTVLSLDESSGNYLRIQGITFTQESEENLTADDYFKLRSNFANPVYLASDAVVSPDIARNQYLDIKNSRRTYGKKEFSLSADYVQSQDSANDLMGWLISKTMKPRLSIGLSVFGAQQIQLGDIVKVAYTNSDNVDLVANKQARFVVYSIEYDRGPEGPSMTVFLSEVA